MASLSNINGVFDVHSTGAIQFNGNHGTAGQILKSNGNAAPTWVAASTVIGGPYLPLTGGTLSGATATASGISFTVGGTLTGTSATFSGFTTSATGFGINYVSGTTVPMVILANAPTYGIFYREATPDYIEFKHNNVVQQSFDGSGNVTIAGDFTISGGDITLGGTGRIQGVDTVTDSTDAANKAYVDAHPGSGGTVTSIATSNGITGGTITTTGTVSLTGTYTGRWNGTTGYYIKDTRASDITPADSTDKAMNLGFTNQVPGNGNWQSYIQMKGWSDGYTSWQIIGPSTTTAYENWYLRSGKGTSWNAARQIWHSGNLPNPVQSSGVTSVATGNGLTGGTITSTGTLSIDSTVATLAGTQTFTGQKTFDKLLFQYNSKTLANFNDLNNTQFEVSMYNVYNLAVASTGMLSTYGTLFEVNGQSGHDKTQFAFNGGNGYIQYRKSWYPNTAWTSFRQIWDSGNLPNPTQGGPYLPLSGGIMSGNIGRSAWNSGYQVGGYNNIGASHAKTNPIHAIGTNYEPTATALSNMYGIGFTRADASFMGVAQGSGWGLYVASDGDARIFLDGSSGNMSTVGNTYAAIYYDYNNTVYYGDFAGTSIMSRINVGNGNNPAIVTAPNSSYGAGTELEIGGWSTGTSLSKIRNSNGNLHIDSKNGHNVYLNHYPPGNILVGNGGGYLLAYQSMRSPIFYDSNNTAYYGNFASTSVLNALQFNYTQHGSANNIRMGNSTTMNAISSGTNNAAFGVEALGGCSTGSRNFAYGYASLYSLSSGGSNIAMGDATGYNVTSGSNNLLFGQNAGRTGYQSPYQSIAGVTSGSNQIHMGNESHSMARIQISWTVNSDARDKTDITPINVGLDFVKDLNPVTFRWDKRSDYEDRTPTGENKLEELTLGFLAQEVEEVEKSYGYDVANKTNLVVDRDVEQDHYGITYEKMIPILTKAIQEQQVIINDLKSRIEILENN